MKHSTICFREPSAKRSIWKSGTITTQRIIRHLSGFLKNEREDYEWFQPWLDHVRDTTGRGVAMNRVRVVTVPLNDYTRYAKHVARLNVDAGEDVRYLPRRLIGADELTADDWWLFDDEVVAFTVFDPGKNGKLLGGAVTTDPQIVNYVRGVKERVWSLAVPLAEYSEP